MQADTKSVYADNSQELNSVVGTPPTLEGRGEKHSAFVLDSTPANHFFSWACTHSETGYGTGQAQQYQNTKVESLCTGPDTYSLVNQLPYIINY